MSLHVTDKMPLLIISIMPHLLLCFTLKFHVDNNVTMYLISGGGGGMKHGWMATG